MKKQGAVSIDQTEGILPARNGRTKLKESPPNPPRQNSHHNHCICSQIVKRMRFLDRPKTAGPSLARAPALYQSVPAGIFHPQISAAKSFSLCHDSDQNGTKPEKYSLIIVNHDPAGVGTSGPNRDLFQERQALSGIAGTTYEPYQRSKHHRTQHLQFGEGGVLRLDPGKPGVGGRPLFYKPTDSWESSKAGDERLGWSTRPSSAPSKGKPNWIARDKQVKRNR